MLQDSLKKILSEFVTWLNKHPVHRESDEAQDELIGLYLRALLLKDQVDHETLDKFIGKLDGLLTERSKNCAIEQFTTKQHERLEIKEVEPVSVDSGKSWIELLQQAQDAIHEAIATCRGEKSPLSLIKKAQEAFSEAIIKFSFYSGNPKQTSETITPEIILGTGFLHLREEQIEPILKIIDGFQMDIENRFFYRGKAPWLQPLTDHEKKLWRYIADRITQKKSIDTLFDMLVYIHQINYGYSLGGRLASEQTPAGLEAIVREIQQINETIGLLQEKLPKDLDPTQNFPKGVAALGIEIGFFSKKYAAATGTQPSLSPPPLPLRVIY